MAKKENPNPKPIIKKPIEKAFSERLGDAKNKISGQKPFTKSNDPGDKPIKPTEIRDKHEE